MLGILAGWVKMLCCKHIHLTLMWAVWKCQFPSTSIWPWCELSENAIHLTLMWDVQTRRDHHNPGHQPEAPQEWLWRARWSVGTIKFQTSHITFKISRYKPSIILDSPQHLAWVEGWQMRSRECRSKAHWQERLLDSGNTHEVWSSRKQKCY